MRRRFLLLSIGALTLLGISPVFGHHLTRGAATLFAGADHVGELCLVALHVLLAPVHGFFHLLLVAGVAYATWDRVRAWLRLRAVLAPLDVVAPIEGDVFWTAARSAGIGPALVCIVDGLPNPAFTVGLLRPRIYVAAQLAERLTGAELTAVLAHEGAHAARRDPLRLSVLRFFAYLLFWLPALRRLAADVADEAEVQADDSAAGDEPFVLALAIVATAGWAAGIPEREAAPASIVGFNRHGILERRVRRLAGEQPSSRSHVTRGSLVGAAAALLLVWTSGVAVAHPLPEGAGARDAQLHSAAADCVRHDDSAVLRALCARLSYCAMHHHCPRRGA